MLELMLTQKVIKESSSHASSKGYLQHLQIDPFAVHLHTDTGINILAEHLKQTATALYLDATGGVVQKIPDQNKRVLYYALVLPGMGKDKPPLPVTEMITNSHSIPSIYHWLMEFQRKLSYCVFTPKATGDVTPHSPGFTERHDARVEIFQLYRGSRVMTISVHSLIRSNHKMEERLILSVSALPELVETTKAEYKDRNFIPAVNCT